MKAHISLSSTGRGKKSAKMENLDNLFNDLISFVIVILFHSQLRGAYDRIEVLCKFNSIEPHQIKVLHSTKSQTFSAYQQRCSPTFPNNFQWNEKLHYQPGRWWVNGMRHTRMYAQKPKANCFSRYPHNWTSNFISITLVGQHEPDD